MIITIGNKKYQNNPRAILVAPTGRRGGAGWGLRQSQPARSRCCTLRNASVARVPL